MNYELTISLTTGDNYTLHLNSKEESDAAMSNICMAINQNKVVMLNDNRGLNSRYITKIELMCVMEAI